mmetsp:Transcript_113330/g.200055  ORF Transcript_113330/g.200055 Transcript_113330/m.200055 type:complete len:290 (-) Transcript_113330:4379-5248(-)
MAAALLAACHAPNIRMSSLVVLASLIWRSSSFLSPDARRRSCSRAAALNSGKSSLSTPYCCASCTACARARSFPFNAAFSLGLQRCWQASEAAGGKARNVWLISTVLIKRCSSPASMAAWNSFCNTSKSQAKSISDGRAPRSCKSSNLATAEARSASSTSVCSVMSPTGRIGTKVSTTSAGISMATWSFVRTLIPMFVAGGVSAADIQTLLSTPSRKPSAPVSAKRRGSLQVRSSWTTSVCPKEMLCRSGKTSKAGTMKTHCRSCCMKYLSEAFAEREVLELAKGSGNL